MASQCLSQLSQSRLVMTHTDHDTMWKGGVYFRNTPFCPVRLPILIPVSLVSRISPSQEWHFNESIFCNKTASG